LPLGLRLKRTASRPGRSSAATGEVCHAGNERAKNETAVADRATGGQWGLDSVGNRDDYRYDDHGDGSHERHIFLTDANTDVTTLVDASHK